MYGVHCNLYFFSKTGHCWGYWSRNIVHLPCVSFLRGWGFVCLWNWSSDHFYAKMLSLSSVKFIFIHINVTESRIWTRIKNFLVLWRKYFFSLIILWKTKPEIFSFVQKEKKKSSSFTSVIQYLSETEFSFPHSNTNHLEMSSSLFIAQIVFWCCSEFPGKKIHSIIYSCEPQQKTSALQGKEGRKEEM